MILVRKLRRNRADGKAFLFLPLLSLALVVWPPRVVPPRARVEKVETALGRVKVFFQPQAGEKELGVPLYPGARTLASSSYRVLTAKNKLGIWLAQALLASTDPPEKILAFYRGKLRGAVLAPEGSTTSLVRASAKSAIIVKLESKPSPPGSTRGGATTAIEIKRVERGVKVTSEFASPPREDMPHEEAPPRGLEM